MSFVSSILILGLLTQPTLGLEIPGQTKPVQDTVQQALCKKLTPRFEQIYNLHKLGVQKPITQEIVVYSSKLHPILQYPLYWSVEMIYLLDSKQSKQLKESRWISTAVQRCSEMIGPSFESPRMKLPFYDYSQRNTSYEVEENR